MNLNVGIVLTVVRPRPASASMSSWEFGSEECISGSSECIARNRQDNRGGGCKSRNEE